MLTTYGYVESTDLDGHRTGYRIDSSVLDWCRISNTDDPGNSSTNLFFRALYENVARLLDDDDSFLHQLEAREHTAQVDTEIREEREIRFRRGLEPAGLPISLLHADYGARCRHLHAQHGLHAERTSDACELRTA